MTNPYAQAGWFDKNEFTKSLERGHYSTFKPTPPTIGALPRSHVETSPNYLRFTFDSVDGDIIDCAVMGSGDHKLFEITTDSAPDGSIITTFTKNTGTVFARIEWATMPVVEIEDTLAKQQAYRWIRQPIDGRQIMTFKTEEYTWEKHKRTIYFYKPGERGENPELMAKFSQKDEVLILDVTPKAISIGIMESMVVALVILTEHPTIERG